MRGLLKFWTYTRKQKENECLYMYMILVISVYLSSLPVAHLSDAPGRRLVLGEGGGVDSARIQDETTERSAWFCYVLGV